MSPLSTCWVAVHSASSALRIHKPMAQGRSSMVPVLLVSMLALGCNQKDQASFMPDSADPSFLEEGERDPTLPPPTAIELDLPAYVPMGQAYEGA
jgi:hypothetical protein